jgi:adenosylhomocysteine nucleosidase
MNLRSRRLKAAAATAAALAVAGSLAFSASAGVTGARAAGSHAAGTWKPEAPIGIISADPEEQAPILAKIHVTSHETIAGYTYYVGTMGGKPVVDAACGEANETAELCAYILDTTFHPRATLFSGTAGAQNAKINVGDVVLSGYVADKSQIHYQLGGYQTAYSGIELHAVKGSDAAGAIVNSYGNVYPTPADAKNFNNGNDPTDKSWIFVSAFAATKELVTTAEHAPTGANTVADATGNAKAKGTFSNKIVVGTIGEANVWTEPLPWIEAQNMLFQTDAEENEGSGFAWANAAVGVPWMLVRGISDTPWFPNAYDSIIASDRAAAVVGYLVAHLPATVSKAPVTMSTLSEIANAREAGYLVANQAYFTATPVTRVDFTSPRGKSVTLTGKPLAKLAREYKYSAAHPYPASPGRGAGADMEAFALRAEEREGLGGLRPWVGEGVRYVGIELRGLARDEQEVTLAEEQAQAPRQDVQPLVPLVRLLAHLAGRRARRVDQLERLDAARPPGERQVRHAVPDDRAGGHPRIVGRRHADQFVERHLVGPREREQKLKRGPAAARFQP